MNLNSLRNFFKPENYDDEYDNNIENIDDFENDEENYNDEYEYDEKVTKFTPRFPNIIKNKDHLEKDSSLNSSDLSSVIRVSYPETYSEVTNIIDSLKSKKIVIVNFKNMKAAQDKSKYDCQKEAFDFINGAVYALEGEIEKLSETIFLIVPNSAKIDSDINIDLDSDFLEKGKNRWVI